MRELFPSPLGILLAEEENGFLTGLRLLTEEPGLPLFHETIPLGIRLRAELDAYFRGELTEFSIPVKAEGTDFQMRVFAELRKIPYGETRTYGQIAGAVGMPQAARAVGGACHRNPVLLLIPCHRVIGSSGKTGGFACGTAVKKQLLTLEKSAAF